MRFSFESLAASVGSMRRSGRWLLLAGVSAVLVTVLEWLGVTAALLLGSMLAAVVVGALNGDLRVPDLGFRTSQAIVGVLVATAITPDIVTSFMIEWPLYLAVVIATLLASTWLGWRIARTRILPGTTAIWGSSPGGASAMVLMADAFGADARLVAFMQYLRVLCVTLAASVVAALWTDAAPAEAPVMAGTDWFPAYTAMQWLATVGLILLGVLLGNDRRIAAAAFLAPMIVGGALASQGLVAPALPPWLLAASFVVLGWSIGVGFTLDILRIALRALPWILGSIAALMLFCGGLALLLVVALEIDPLTAYLATSPGGLDSVAVIAAASDVDLAFVVTLQTVRLVIVVLAGPPLAKLVVRLTRDRGG